MICPVIELAQQLIKRPSLSPSDAGCQEIMIQRLAAIGFTIEPMNFGDTLNFGHGVAKAKRWHLLVTRMWCLPVTRATGTAHRLNPPSVTACCMAEVPQT